MDDLLKEAIADAKAVRETALANAKMALEEAFTPRLKSMLAQKIQHEVEDEKDAEEGYDEVEDEEEGMGHDEVEDAEEGEGHDEVEDAEEISYSEEEGEEEPEVEEEEDDEEDVDESNVCLLYTSPSPRDATLSRMPSSA